MIKLLFTLPLALCFLWFLYLKHNGYTLRQGKQGFLYILVISAVIALFYTMMLWLTH